MSEELRRGIPKAIKTGEVIDYTEEERRRNDEVFEKILKRAGVLEDDEHIINSQVVKGKKDNLNEF